MPKSNITLEQWCISNNHIDLLSHLVNKNDKYISYASHSKIDWICDLGHIFSIDPCKFTNTARCRGNLGIFKCPICNGQRVIKGFNDLATTRPDLAKEWNYNRNNILPSEVTKGSKKTVWWKCLYNPSHEWQARISARNYANNSCPYCSSKKSTSKSEQYLYYYCREAFTGHEVFNKYKLNGVELDIYIPDYNLAIEFDGIYWHSNKNTDYKFDFCRSYNIDLIKILESNKLTVNNNIYTFDASRNLYDNNYTKCLNLLFRNFNSLYGVKFPDINLSRDYKIIVSMFNNATSTVKAKWLDDLRPYWDTKLNGYDIDYMENDGKGKYWRCINGHSYKRRLDVINFNNSNVCPYCKKPGNFQFYIINWNNSEYIVYDKDYNTIESVTYTELYNYIQQGINIQGIVFKNNTLSLDMSWIERASNTAIRSIFSNLYTDTLKNVSSSQLCTNTYNALLYLRNNDSMQAFIRYLKKNNKVITN